MNTDIQRRLDQSLEHLESAIATAKQSLQSLPTRNPEIERRLDEYAQVVKRQRVQSSELTASIEAGAWPEVYRQAQLIRQSSSLIQNDVISLLREIASGGRLADQSSEFEA